MERKPIAIYDTTLRDGAQDPEINYTLENKLKIALALDKFGMDYIEGGWPGSNSTDTEFFRQIQNYKLSHSKIAAFGSTRKKGISAENDKNLGSIVNSKAQVATIFGKCNIEHVKNQLRMKPEENLAAIYESLMFLKQKMLEVHFDGEHFIDGFKKRKDYALSCLENALKAGADYLVLCDTNGGNFYWDILKIVKEIENHFYNKGYKEFKLGIHCHNDNGFALTNPLTLVHHGYIDQIQGTVNGFGERAGNTDLCFVLPDLHLMGIPTNADKNLNKIYSLSKFLYEVAGIEPYSSQPFVGENVFAHKAGIHLDGLNKGASYEFMPPEIVGNTRKIILSSLAGKGGVLAVLNSYGFETNKDDNRVGVILEKIQEMESLRYNIGLMEAEHYILAREVFNPREYFKIIDHKVDIHGTTTSCSLEIQVDGLKADKKITVTGGPVDAFYHAMQQILKEKYKKIGDVEFIGYKAKELESGSESPVRVCCKFKHNNGVVEDWTTVGVNKNIVEASLEAIRKGFQYCLLKNYN